jgi:hypothetical protein
MLDCFKNITLIILDIIDGPAFYLNQRFGDRSFCLRVQVVPTQLGPIDRATHALCGQSGFHLKMRVESCL